MRERRSSPRFDISIKARLDLREKGVLEGTMGNLSASGDGIMVRSDNAAQVGDIVDLEMPVPVQMQTIRCEGKVIYCRECNSGYEIGIHISSIGEQFRENLRMFSRCLMPYTRSETVDYLIQQGESALKEASEVTIGESMSAELGAFMHELLSLKYHDALRSFEDALKIDVENEAALEGFCFSLAKAVSHYEHAGLSRLAETVKVKALPYCTDKALAVAERSPRMSEYSLGIIRGMFS